MREGWGGRPRAGLPGMGEELQGWIIDSGDWRRVQRRKYGGCLEGKAGEQESAGEEPYNILLWNIPISVRSWESH